MFDKLDFILEKYEELSLKVSDPDVINNQKLWQKHIKEMGEMEPIVNKYREYKKAKEAVAEAKEMLDSGDEELRELAKMEIAEYEEQLPQLEEQLKILLLPKDPNDDKNVILEVRAGKRLRCSRRIFCVCICATRSAAAGRRRLWTPMIPVSAVSRKPVF